MHYIRYILIVWIGCNLISCQSVPDTITCHFELTQSSDSVPKTDIQIQVDTYDESINHVEWKGMDIQIFLDRGGAENLYTFILDIKEQKTGYGISSQAIIFPKNQKITNLYDDNFTGKVRVNVPASLESQSLVYWCSVP